MVIIALIKFACVSCVRKCLKIKWWEYQAGAEIMKHRKEIKQDKCKWWITKRGCWIMSCLFNLEFMSTLKTLCQCNNCISVVHSVFVGTSKCMNNSSYLNIWTVWIFRMHISFFSSDQLNLFVIKAAVCITHEAYHITCTQEHCTDLVTAYCKSE